MKPTFHVNGDVKKHSCCFYVTEDPYALHELPFNSPKFTFVLCCRFQFWDFLAENWRRWMGDCHSRLLWKEGDTCVLYLKSGWYVCSELEEWLIRVLTWKVVGTCVLNLKSGWCVPNSKSCRYVWFEFEKLLIRVFLTWNVVDTCVLNLKSGWYVCSEHE
jgi:hypothetical protein